MTHQEIGQQVRVFIQQNFLFDENTDIGEAESLISSGTVDSTGIMELIAFVEHQFNVQVEDGELTAENFDSVANISAFVFRHLSARIPVPQYS